MNRSFNKKIMKFNSINRNTFKYPTASYLFLVLLLWTTILSTAVNSFPMKKTNGTTKQGNDRRFVKDVTQCPSLSPRAITPENVRDLRADDIKVIS